MDWAARMNNAVAVIEEGISGEIDVEAAARAAGCSSYHFFRMFSYLAGMPLSEYVRRRRLTLAALELSGGKAAVVDVAVKYSYDSREAFTRAFARQHGVSPSAVRGGKASHRAFSRVSFHHSNEGGCDMEYTIRELGPFAAVGKRYTVKTEGAFQEIPAIWVKAREEDLFWRLWDMRAPGEPFGGVLGVLSGGNWGKNETFEYTLAIAADAPAPEGMTRFEFPRSLWVVFNAPGRPEALQDAWRQLYTQWVPSCDAVYGLAPLPAVENYLPIEDFRNELWVPIVRRQEF